MSITIENLDRKRVAAQLRLIRGLERDGFGGDTTVKDGWNRDMMDYVNWLSGISIFLDYARNIKENGRILDIGSGKNVGITEIARSKMGEGLSFIGTNLSKVPGLVEDTSPARIIRTSAEVLHGVEDESISGILSLTSIAYSESPLMVATSMDRVLVPGGAIKAFFNPRNCETDFSRQYNYKTHDEFSNALRNMGYDVAVRDGVD